MRSWFAKTENLLNILFLLFSVASRTNGFSCGESVKILLDHIIARNIAEEAVASHKDGLLVLELNVHLLLMQQGLEDYMS